MLTLEKFNLSVHSEIWLESHVEVTVAVPSPVDVPPHWHRNQSVAHHGWHFVHQEGLKGQLELLGRMRMHW